MENKKKIMVIVILLLTLPFFSTCTSQDDRFGSYVVTVNADNFDRVNVIVSLSLPEQIEDGIYLLQDDSNEPLYLQVDDNKGRFILENLSAGASKVYTFRTEPLARNVSALNVTNEIDSTSIKVKSGENTVLGYFYEENEVPGEINSRFKRAGYIHPVYTPEGVRITQHFNPNRPHHYGIWSAWLRAEIQDRTIGFWSAQGGKVVADTLEQIWEGPVHGGFRTNHRFVEFSVPEPITILNEQWEVIVYQAPHNGNYHVFDINITQTAINGNSIEIPSHSYGGINFRGHDDWIGEGKMNFISSEGFNRSEVLGQRVRWNHLSGYIEGKFAGVGLLGHPANGNNSNGVFINQNYEPFFSYGPAPLGNTLIKPGAPWVARYRLISHDGKLKPEDLERLWNDYAYPPTASLKTGI